MGNYGPFYSYGCQLTLYLSACLRLGFMESECRKIKKVLRS